MKHKLLTLIATLLCSMTIAISSAHAATIYTVFDDETQTLTYYHNTNYDSGNNKHEKYDPVNNPLARRFVSYHSKVKKVVIHVSMRNATLTSFCRMFYGGYNSEGGTYNTLTALTTIEGLENLNTANVTDMSWMFYGCSALTSIDLSALNTDNVTDMSYMFQGCSKLTTIYCNDSWNARASLTSSAYMFDGCTKLVGGKGTVYNSSKTDKSYARLDGGSSLPGYFTQIKKIYTVYDASTHTLTYRYDNSYNLDNHYHELYDPVGEPSALRFAAYHDQVEKAVIDPSMKDARLTSTRRMFYGGYSSGNYNLSNMTTIEGMTNLNTGNVTDMNNMFYLCMALTSVDLTSFDISKVTTMTYMFHQCSALTTIYCEGDWSTSTASSNPMFTGCTALVGGEGTAYDADIVNKAYARMDGGPKAPGYFTSKSKAKKVYTVFDEETLTLTYRYDNEYYLSNPYHEFYDPVNNPDAVRFNTYYSIIQKVVIAPSMKNAPLKSLYRMFYGGYNEDTKMYQNLSALTTIEGLENLNTAIVTDMSQMFSRCSALTAIDVNSFNIAKVTDMSHLFNECSALAAIYCDADWSTSAALTNSNYMFYGCEALVGGEGTAYDESKVDKTYARVDGGSSAPGYFTKVRKVYTAFDQKTQTLTYRYDSNYDLSNAYQEEYDPVNNPSATRFALYNSLVKKAIIAPSMKEAPLTSMYRMFFGGYNSETDETYHLTNMTAIEGLENLNTAIVTNMSAMFYSCTALTSLDLSSFNTANVKNMNYMFLGCLALKSLDLSSFDVSKVITMYSIFYRCYALTTIYCADDWSTSATLTDSQKMFSGCTALVGGEGTTYNSEVVDKTYARLDGGLKAPGYFTSKSKAKKVYTVYDDVKQTLTYRYDNSYDLSSPYQEVYDPVGKPSDIRFTDYHDQVVKAVIDPSMKEAPLTSTKNMFYGGYMGKNYNLSAMTAIEGIENLNTASVTTMMQMFASCLALESLDLSTFNTKQVTDMSSMFDNCSSLQSLNLNYFDISNVTTLVGMFSSCSELTTIFCDTDWSGTSAASDHMFAVCNKLVGGKGTAWNSSYTDATYARPDGGTKAPGYFTKRTVYTEYDEATQTLTYYYDDQMPSRSGVTEVYDPVNNPSALRFTDYYDQVVKAVIDPSMKEAPLTSMRNMFYGGFNSTSFDEQSLSKMTTVEGLENLNTAIVTDMYRMFYFCQSLTSIDLSTFNTKNVTNMYSMFIGCKALQTLDLTSFDISKVENTRQMFASCSALTTIYCSNDWSISPTLTDSYMMFSGCNKLEGGQGTMLISDGKLDKTYARPDGGTEKPGYFTKRPKVYTVFDETEKTLTYYYGSNYDESNPYFEEYDPANDSSPIRFTGYHNQVKKAIIDPSMKDAPLTSMRMMFFGNYIGSELNYLSNMTVIEGLENLNTTQVENMSLMFNGCSALTSLDLSSFNTANVTVMTDMFRYCHALTSLDLSSFNTSNVTIMYGMFDSCKALTTLDLSSFDVSKLAVTFAMFSDCFELTTIYCKDDWSTSAALASSEKMFDCCYKLVGGKGTTYNGAVIDATYARPDGGTEAPGYFTAYVKGDANGDGNVTITDAVAIVNKILGNASGSFNEAAADVNRDGEITITDAVGVVNIILNNVSE